MRDTTVSTRGSRRARHLAERQERREAALAAIGVILLLAAFALAGTLDLQDRTEGLGASMVPSPEWQGTAW